MSAKPLFAAATAAALAGSTVCLAQSETSFTYQGALEAAGSPVDTPSDFIFRVYDAATDGTQIGEDLLLEGVPVTDGLFTAEVDFGTEPFTGQGPLWLEVEVRNPAGFGSFVTFGERRPLTGVPFSLATRGIDVDADGNLLISGDLQSTDGNIVLGGRQRNAPGSNLAVRAGGNVDSSPWQYRGGELLLAAGNANTSAVDFPEIGTSFGNDVVIQAGDNVAQFAFGELFNGNIRFIAGHGLPERMRLVGDTGQLLIGTSDPSSAALLVVNGDIQTTNLVQTSTGRLKTDITPLSDALDAVMRLRGVEYAWNDLAPRDIRGRHDIGFIAEEVDQVLPDIVSKDAQGRAVGIDYGKLAPVAIEAIKTLKHENDALRARLEVIEARLADTAD